MPETDSTARRSNGLVISALVIAVAALAVAIWSLLRAPSTNDAASDSTDVSSATAEQSSDPTSHLCGAFDQVRSAVSLQTNADLGQDPVAKQTVAANARLATLGGGQYLLTQLSPAVPTELSDEVRTFANTLQDIGMSQLAGTQATGTEQVDRLASAQETAGRITELCQQ